MDFESQYNKRLLWQLMSDNNIFAGIPDTKVEAVKSMFEKEISIVNNKKMSLLEKNKKILVTMNTKLNYLRVTSIKSKPATKETDLLKERTAVMQSKLEDKKEEFNNLMNTKQPEKIDFADDNEDKPIGSEMDQLLANMMENRKQQLNQVMQKQDTNAVEVTIEGIKYAVVQDTGNVYDWDSYMAKRPIQVGQLVQKGKNIEFRRL